MLSSSFIFLYNNNNIEREREEEEEKSFNKCHSSLLVVGFFPHYIKQSSLFKSNNAGRKAKAAGLKMEGE